MDDFVEISLQDAFTLTDKQKYLHCAHCLLYCSVQYEDDKCCKFAFMQMRNDGYFGFPGGECDDQITTVEHLLDNLNRELAEEICFNIAENAITASDYVFTHRWWHKDSNKYFVLHFFAKQLTVEAFEWIERNHTKAEYFPSESLGLIRVPILDESMKCFSQFKCYAKFMENFAKHQFIGNAKQQLFETVKKLNLSSSCSSNSKSKRDS